MNRIYRGLERDMFDNTPEGEKAFWHEQPDEYTPSWTTRVIEDGNIMHYTSEFFEPISLGKFKHILNTENENFEYRVFEKGILRLKKPNKP